MNLRFSSRLGLSLTAGVLAVVLAGPAVAHDAWLTFAGDAPTRRVVVHYGHPDDRPPALGDKVLDLAVFRPAGSVSLVAGLAVERDGEAVVAVSKPFADDGHGLAVARYDNGYWVKTKDGLYHNATRRMVPDAAEVFWSGKFAKALSGPGAPWQKEFGHDLEIVPLADPAAVRRGGELVLRVLFKGKPLAGAEVERGDGVTPVPEKDIPRFKTDAEGVARVPVVASGAHLIVVDHKASPSLEPAQADSDLFNATLWFRVAD